MIISDKIKTAYAGLVGWNQSTYSGYDVVSAANLLSSTGLKFQDASPLVTIKNIKDCQENPSITDEQFNTLITNMYNDSVLSVCNRVLANRSSLRHSYNLYPYEKSFNDKLTPSSRFVGFRIQSWAGLNLVNQISWIELSFDTEATFNIYLYNSNLKDPIQTQEVITSAGESKIVNLNWNLSDDATYKGGTFYIGYFEDDLSGAKAYEKDWELANAQRFNDLFEVFPVEVDFTGTVLNVEDVEYGDKIWGLNLGINVFKDYTQLMIVNKERLANAIQLQMHEKVLQLIINSTRSNRTERILKNAEFELYGNPEYHIEGVNDKLNREIKTLQKFLFSDNVLTLGTLG